MRIFRWVLYSFPIILLLSMLTTSCQSEPKGSRAVVIKSRTDLIGGPMALGAMDDYLLENSKIRAVVAKHGISRAFGIFGGNLVDLDRVRTGAGQGNSAGGSGFDSLVEMFPLFFLSVVDTTSSKIINDGKDGKPAAVQISGTGASFIALTEQINNFVAFQGGQNHLSFDMLYTLPPGKSYLELTVTLRNDKEGYAFQSLGDKVPAATGVVGLFGKRNAVFVPGTAAYNIRFSLEYAFAKGSSAKMEAPAIPGLIGDFIASHGMNGLSYGIVAEPHKENYVIKNEKEFKKLEVPFSEGSLIVPLEGSSITAAFTRLLSDKDQTSLASKGGKVSYKIYIIVGDGSVSSIRDAQLEIHKKDKGTASGHVFEDDTRYPIVGARVMAFKYYKNKTGNKPGDRIFYSDFVTDAQGRFKGNLEPGDYILVARRRGMKSKEFKLKVEKDKSTYALLTIPRDGLINFTVRDSKGRLIPAKVSVLGKVADFEKGKCVGQFPVYCLFDPHLGDPHTVTDFRVGLRCPDNKKVCASNGDCKGIGDGTCLYRLQPETEFREGFGITHNGRGSVHVRPLAKGKKYKVVASRGTEYELSSKEIEVPAGGVVSVELTLKRVIDNDKMISADLHVHSNLSHDSKISDVDRVVTFAAEGVDYFVITDHNRVRDMQPLVNSLGIERWLKTGVGLELTTFEMGHFNAFPLKVNPNEFHGGNPDWFKKPSRYKDDIQYRGSTRVLKGLREGYSPNELFSAMRKLGSLCNNDPKCSKTIVQVNHPRDSIFGYFNTYNISPDDGFPVHTEGFSSPLSREFDIDKYDPVFDAIEFYNGKRFDLLWHWRIPPNSTEASKMSLKGYIAKEGTLMRVDEEGKANVAYPGGGSDWFNSLNLGRKYTGTANSDTHGLAFEAGTPKNYFLTGFDDPQKMTDEILSKMVLEHKVLMTNGPIIDFTATGGDDKEMPMGSTVKADSKKSVILNIRIRAASWVDVTEVMVYKNGRLARTLDVKEKKKVVRLEEKLSFDVSDGDAWFVVVAKGKKDLWPVYIPEEIEPFQIAQSVSLIQNTLLASVGGQFNLGSSDQVCLIPSQATLTIPYAITNPIWVDTNGDGYKPDPCRTLGEKGVRCNASGSTCKAGRCVGSKSCKNDADCDNKSYCHQGSCTVDACDGLTCSKAFEKCDNNTACPNDFCPAKDKRCKDGKVCSKDSDCKDGKCRYCACPAPRKACDDGTVCTTDKDCKESGHTCKDRRFCPPTGCALGYCAPTHPLCGTADINKAPSLYMEDHSVHRIIPAQKIFTAKNIQKMVSKYMTPAKPRVKQAGGKNRKNQSFEIRKTHSFFLFFEHRH